MAEKEKAFVNDPLVKEWNKKATELEKLARKAGKTKLSDKEWDRAVELREDLEFNLDYEIDRKYGRFDDSGNYAKDLGELRAKHLKNMRWVGDF